MAYPDQEKAHLLIADDDPDFAESVKDILEREGYSVWIAKNGRQAVDRVRGDGIQLLILDMGMPVLNGLYVCLELKASGHILPTIIVTAYTDEESGALKLLKSMPTTRIMYKPFNPKVLLAEVRALLEAREEV